jgi:acyl carrier protein
MSTSPVTGEALTGGEADAADANCSGISRAALDRALKAIIADVLGIDPDQADGFDHDSGLFGHLPELDSMAVAGLLTEMEDRLDIVIEDDDVDGEMLETYGGLLAFAEAKLTGA